MRIAYIYDAVYPWVKGGAEKRIYEVAKRLRDRNHDVHILGLKYWPGRDSHCEEGLSYHSLGRPVPFFNGGGRRSIFEALFFGLRSWNLLGAGRFDVVDCGQWPYFHLPAAKTYSLLHGASFVISWYEVWKRHWLEYLGKAGIFGMLAERTFCRFPHKVVAISEMTRDDLVDLGVKPGRVTVIPNGIDYRRIQSLAPGPIATHLAYCGRLKNHKNVHLLVQAVALLKRSMPDISAVIIGDGPESSALRKLAAELGVERNIVFTGVIDDFDEVVRWLKASKIFVHPSTKEGGGSITFFEANASGLPVIAIRCPNGIDPRLLREGINGYFVDRAKPESIACTALTLLQSPDRLAANAASSQQMASAYDWEMVASRYEEVYAQEVHRRKFRRS